MYKVFLNKSVAKYYEAVDSRTARTINKAIEALSTNPIDGPHIKRLRGMLEGKYRYDMEDLRIVYRISTDSLMIFIEAIGQK
jgi:mRNA-degrading endonuclease RelE of RelBE toxin-antitoxin system